MSVSVMPAPPQEWVNADRILARVAPSMFQAGAPVFLELVQNAWRAGASNLHVDMKGTTASLLDDGQGVTRDGLVDMLTLGASGFEQQGRLRETMPAGMGLFALIAHADSVVLRSHFGSLAIDCRLWLKSRAYRDATLARIDAADTHDGMHIEVAGAEKAFGETVKFIRRGDRGGEAPLGLYTRSMAIYLNGHTAHTVDPRACYEHCVPVDGVDVWFLPSHWVDAERYSEHSLSYLLGLTDERRYRSKSIIVGWYNHPIRMETEVGPSRGWSTSDFYYVDVLEGQPFTPKLPDRDTIIKNDQWAQFEARLAEATADALFEHMATLTVEGGAAHQQTLETYARLCQEVRPERYAKEAPYAIFSVCEERTPDRWEYWEHEDFEMRTSPVALRRDAIASSRIVPQGALAEVEAYYGDERLTVDAGRCAAFFGNAIAGDPTQPLYLSTGPARLTPGTPTALDEVHLECHDAEVVGTFGLLHAPAADLVFGWADGVTQRYPMPHCLLPSVEFTMYGYDDWALVIGPDLHTVFRQQMLESIIQYSAIDLSNDEIEMELEAYRADLNAYLDRYVPVRRHLGDCTALMRLAGGYNNIEHIDLSSRRTVDLTLFNPTADEAEQQAYRARVEEAVQYYDGTVRPLADHRLFVSVLCD